MSLPSDKDNRHPEANDAMMSFGDHLEVLRQMLFRILAVAGVLAVVVFCNKDITWQLLLAPSRCDFLTFRLIEDAMQAFGVSDFHFEEYHVDLISTELSSQFMAHITTAVYLGLLGASPYVLYELFRFVSPALYANERRYSGRIMVIVYLLFALGVALNYYVLFPISFRFLGTYSVSESIRATITLDSYIETFTALTLTMGIVFQLPILSFALARFGLISSALLSKYRRHALVLIMIVAATITPPDVMTLILVTIPLYMLYEISVVVVRKTEK